MSCLGTANLQGTPSKCRHWTSRIPELLYVQKEDLQYQHQTLPGIKPMLEATRSLMLSPYVKEA